MSGGRGRLSMVTLTAAQAAGQTGSWAALVAALPLALSRPDPALWLALVNAVWAGPAMLSQLAGRPIDRYGPRRVGAVCWAAAAVCSLGALATGHLPAVVVPLGLMSAFRGAGVAAGDTAPTWLPHRPDLTRAGSWLMIAAAIPVLVGPLGSATLLAYLGSRPAWLVVTGLFVFGAIGSALVPAIRPVPAPLDDADLADIAAADAAAVQPKPAPRFRGRFVAILVITAGTWLSYGALEILQPLYVKQGLHSSLIMYGWMMVAFALGSVAAALAAVPLRRITASRWTVPFAVLAVAAGERLFTGTSSVSYAFAGSAVWGAAAALFTLASRSAILSAIPAESHGRALSTWRAIQSSADIAPTAIIGQLTAVAGLSAVLSGTCALAGVAGLLYLIGAVVARAVRRTPQAAVSSAPEIIRS
jgi:hypothetical protein